MESSDGWSLGWTGVDALCSIFDPAPAPGDPTPGTAAPARPEPKFDPTGARARLYDQRIAYSEKATEAVALTADLRAWRPEDGDDANALKLATTLVDWSLAVLSYGGLGARPAKGKAKTGGGGDEDGEKKRRTNGPPPPRAAGADPPTPRALCADTTLWRALHAGLAHGAVRGVHGKVTPSAAATSHLLLAATTAAAAAAAGSSDDGGLPSIDARDDDDDDDENMPSLIAESLGHVRARLGREYKPAPEQCVACASAVVTRRASKSRSAPSPGAASGGDRWKPLTDECFRLLHHVVLAHGQNKPAPVVPDALMARMLRDAVGDVEGAAGLATRALVLHPTHRTSVPAAFAAAGGKPVPKSTRGSLPGKRRKGTEGNKGGADDAGTEDAKGDDAEAEDGTDGEEAGESKVWNRTLPAPEYVRNAARTIVNDGECVRLAPWLFRSFVEDANASAGRSGKRATLSAGSKNEPVFVNKPGRCLPAVRGDAKLLWDALFEPCVRFETGDGFRAEKGGEGADGRRRRGRGVKRGIDTAAGDGAAGVGVRDATSRRRVAAALVRACDVAGLYSYIGGDDAAPAPDRLNVRDRLGEYANALFAKTSKTSDVSPDADSAPPGKVTSSKAATCAAATALLEVDVRIVEPHCAAIVAEVLRAADAEERDAAAAAQFLTTLVRQYAATRQLPSLLSKIGAAVASLRDDDAPFEVGASLDHPAVLEAAGAEVGRMLSGMISQICVCAHGAMSHALGRCEWGTGANTSGHGARCAALGAVIAKMFHALPAPAGQALDPGAQAALEELSAEICGRLRDWFASASGSTVGVDAKKKEKKRKKKDNDEEQKQREEDGSPRDSRVSGAGDASIAGALLSVYVQAQAILEICHDRDELYSFHRRPYLFTPDAPPIVSVVAAILNLDPNGDRDHVGERTHDGLDRHGAAAAKSRATATAGAALQRVVQLAKIAEPPPAGVSDPDAIEEARALVAVCARACAGGSRAPQTPTADAVRDLMRTCRDVWMAYASPASLREWVSDGGDDVFRDRRLLKLWTREAVRSVVAACEGVAPATGKSSLGRIATEIVAEVGAGAGEETEEVAWSRWRETRVLAAKFWALDEAAWRSEEDAKGGSGKKSGKKSGKRRDERPNETKAKAGLDEMKAAIGRLASTPTQVVDDCDARWLVAACVAADCVAFTAAAARVDSSSRKDDDDSDHRVLFTAVDVMAAARRSVARFANVDEASASFVLAGSTSKTRAIFADASLEMTRRIEKLLKKKVGDDVLGLTLIDADARARTCSFAYATSSYVQASVQRARGDAFFAALRACDASVTPAVREAAEQAHAVLLAAIERVEARRAKRKAEGEAAAAAALRAKMTPRSVKLKRRREEAPQEPRDLDSKPSSGEATAFGGSNLGRTDPKLDPGRTDPKPDPKPRTRDPPPDVGPAAVTALALAEAVLTAATNGVASLGCERDTNAMVDDGNDIKERDDAVDRVGPASTRAWSAVGSLRGATIDKATGALAKLARRSPPAVTDALASALSGGAASAGLAELGIVYSKRGERSRIVPEPDSIRRGLQYACGVLGDCSEDGWIVKYPSGAAKAIDLIRSTVDVFSANGPHLTPTAHAVLLATVLSTYDVSARHVKYGEDDRLPSPPRDLSVALNRAMGSLLHGAGKRLLGAAYRYCIDQMRAHDSSHRSIYPFGKYVFADMSEARHEELGFGVPYDGWETASSLAAPLWCMHSLVNHTGWGGKAARLAATEHAEYACNTLMDCAKMASERGSCGEPGESPSRAVAWAAVNALTTVAGRGKGTPLSSRCCSRMAILPQSICEGLVSVDSCGSLFAGCCALLSCLLRRRTVELKRCSAMYTISCQYLLDAMRRWNARDIEERRARGDATEQAKEAEIEAAALSDDALTREWQRITAIEERESADAFARKMRVAATHMVPVYESANKGKLGTIYCQHLLADAITACTGSAVDAKATGASIGAPAERALKPGIFALMDSVGDREFQQLHMAFVSGQGGARRMILKKFIDEYRRTHKFDGKI